MRYQSLLILALLFSYLGCKDSVSNSQDELSNEKNIEAFSWGDASIIQSSNTATTFSTIIGFTYTGSFDIDSLAYTIELKRNNQILNEQEFHVDSVNVETNSDSSSVQIYFYISELLENETYSFDLSLDYNGKEKKIEQKGFYTAEITENEPPKFLELISDEVSPGIRSADLTILVKINDIVPNSVSDFSYSSVLLISTDSIPTQENNVGFDQIAEIGLVNLDRVSNEGISWRSIVSLKPNTKYFYEHKFYYDNELDEYEKQSVSTGIKSFSTKEEELQFGGIVFYDKGDATEGWQYLVAAPGDWYTGNNEFTQYDWGCSGILIDSTLNGYGHGFENTRRIIDADCDYDENDPPAAVYIDNLQLNGYSDWYLPNLEEISGFIGLADELGICCLPILSSNESDSNHVFIRWHELEQVEAVLKSGKHFIHPIRRE